MKLETRVNKIIEGYTNKPSVTILDRQIHLTGGAWSARQDVEDYFAQKGVVSCVSNKKDSKVIELD